MSDLISRKAMIDAMRQHRAVFCKNRIEFMALPKDEKARVDEIDNCISSLINAPDAELGVFEFCASGENPCKEYDKEKHCCHRWTKVIRQTVEELKSQQPERKKGKWNFIGDNMFECTHCRVVYTTQQLNGLRNYAEDPYAPRFCPNCGADMKGE